MKKMLIAGNWKMNTNVFESEKLVEYILGYLSSKDKLNCDVLVCPPFLSIYPISVLLEDSKLKLGAQNCHFEGKGAFTGEVSLPMLKHCDVSYVIIGHSERRAYFAEDDTLLNKKLKAAFDAEITPILCIGETIDERNSGKTFDVLTSQLQGDLDGIEAAKIKDLVIAYEPVWAIGTGVSATNEQVKEAHDWLRSYLVSQFGENGKETILLYGGSLNDKNADELLALENVNGGLIGGASLNGESFVSIIEFGNKHAV